VSAGYKQAASEHARRAPSEPASALTGIDCVVDDVVHVQFIVSNFPLGAEPAYI